jgi:hypothetical protein
MSVITPQLKRFLEPLREYKLARKNLRLKRAVWLPAFEDLIAGLEIVPSVLFELPVPIADKDAPPALRRDPQSVQPLCHGRQTRFWPPV